jgi:hypothetical protein
MYGILVGCIAMMALFLGLFAVSVEPTAQNEIAAVEQTVQVQAVVNQSQAAKQ